MSTFLSSSKHPLIPIYCAMMLALPSTSEAKVDYVELAEELEIMEQVFETRLRQDQKDSSVKISRVNSNYLAKQGVVFSIGTSSNMFPGLTGFQGISNFDFGEFEIHMRDFAAQTMEDHSETIQEALEMAQEFKRENMREISEQLREVEGQLRDQEWQLRDVERERRDLNFELSRADEERKKEIQEELKALEKEQEKVAADRRSLRDSAKEISEKRKQKAKKKLEERKQANLLFVSNFEKDITDSLCRFGTALRELPKDEHITFVLENFDITAEKKASSRYYVFPAESVKQCAQEKINAQDLLAKAVVYDF